MDTEGNVVAYLTKYALTKGIIKIQGQLEESDGSTVLNTGPKQYGFILKKDYSLSWEEAVSVAENMRDKRVLSLEKQIIKLNSMFFRWPVAP